MLTKITGFFLPPIQGTDNEYQRRVRLTTYAVFITAIFSLFYVLVSWMSGFVIGMLIMLCCFVIFTILLFLLKSGINVFVIANIFGLIGILCISGCIYFSGGSTSPVLPWLATTPIVILLIAGKKSGSVWAVVAVLLIIGFGIMAHTGYIFPKDISTENISFYLSCYAGLVLIIYFISIVFENLRVLAFNAVSAQKDELEQALMELKSTQAQLIQSEKMASLGELTAGIAHEIQNPLNFVKNFSEVNTDLIEELINLKSKTGNESEEDESEILNDIFQNNEKILIHGNRADSIVKGMLQHSRKNTGAREPADINALCDEYLRLSFHGLRAKDKSFNADFKTDFDERIGKINIVPQDIGRVLLNLFNNAFYAVNEKKKSYELLAMSYEPLVSVTTKVSSPSPLERGRDEVIITVKDNGSGIPQNIVDKIFQPFFTTKPTGQGTGLGLSLSYDIIKAHGGEIKVETREGEGLPGEQTGTTFIIQLPVV